VGALVLNPGSLWNRRGRNGLGTKNQQERAGAKNQPEVAARSRPFERWHGSMK